MAKYSVIFENGLKKEELVFRGEIFDITHVPFEIGTMGDKDGFEYQLSDKFTDLNAEDLEEIIDNLMPEFEDELFEALKELGRLE